jgi:hypothetical protein
MGRRRENRESGARSKNVTKKESNFMLLFRCASAEVDRNRSIQAASHSLADRRNDEAEPEHYR